MATPKTIGSGEIHAAITRLAEAISARHVAAQHLLLLGVANGGIELARRLVRQLATRHSRPATKAGVLDISFHRDDIARNPIPKEFQSTHIPGDVNGATVILVDDVLFSGRTVKAALDELFDYGRPTKVELAILVDRGGRRLPFAPDYLGFAVAAKETEKVFVTLDPQDSRRDLIRIAPAAAKIKTAL